MEQILQFILENKYMLIIIFIAFIIQFLGITYLIQNKKSDFSYSGHTFEWFEDDTNKSVLALLSFILGVSVIGICILHIITH
jgi:hypothetical protein